MHRRRKDYFGFFCISCGLIQITRNVYTFLCSFYADEGRKTPGRGCAPGFWGSGSVTEVRRMNKTLVHPRRFQRIVPAYAAYPSSAPQGWGEKRSRAVTLHLFATPGFPPSRAPTAPLCGAGFSPSLRSIRPAPLASALLISPAAPARWTRRPRRQSASR